MRGDAHHFRPRLILLENSLHKTGAFGSALHAAHVLRDTHDVEFILPTASALYHDVLAAGIVCHRLPMTEVGRSWRKLLLYVPMLALNAVRLRRLLARRQIDGLLVNDYYNLLGACVRMTGWTGKIITIVRLLPANQQPLMNRVWITLGLLFTNQLLAVSNAVARQLPPSPKVKVLYNPVNFSEKYESALIRRGGGDGQIFCLYPANYIAGKGHPAALRAFALAWREYPGLRIRFVGGDMGLEKNRALRTGLESEAVRLGVRDAVVFDLFSADIENDIKNSDIVLNFSESESFSNTCVEASVFGRPVIATRCGGPEEIVEHGVTGLLVEVGDVPAMAAAILTLARSASLRTSMSEAGRSHVRAKFSEQAFRSNFLSEFSSTHRDPS